jgi:PqqD family protein of HPr-rel-A system
MTTMTDYRMVQAEEILSRKIGDEVVVLKDDGLELHMLNRTAALIWEMCNGENTAKEIAAVLCERFPVSPEEANADVKETLEKLADLGLLKQAEGASVL